MAAISLEGVTKEYGDVTAVDDLDLAIDEGEVYGFLGPNGAGKSTTINILLDFVRPTSGDISVLGMDPQADSLAIRRRAGLLPEGFDVYGRLTARQHVEFMIDAKRATDDPDDVMERVGIAHAADRRAGGFSKGMRQRLALGMALVGQPDLIIFDEPSTGLDPNGATEVLEIMREEKARGATIFFSSHILGQIEAVCDRVGIMSNGRLIAEGTIDELRDAVGMHRTVTVSVDALRDDTVGAVEALDSVTEVTARDSRLTVTATRGAETEVYETVRETGAHVETFTSDTGSLRELFAAFTQGASEQTVPEQEGEA
ncbi:MAG: ABC transporter ATP-binding protein [Halobacteriaceae archaeon]